MFGWEYAREYWEMTREEREAFDRDMMAILEEEYLQADEDKAQEEAYAELQEILKETA